MPVFIIYPFKSVWCVMNPIIWFLQRYDCIHIACMITKSNLKTLVSEKHIHVSNYSKERVSNVLLASFLLYGAYYFILGC